MTLLALSANETAFWLVALVLVAVLVAGVIALTTTLVRLVRSVNVSMRQLQEVAEVQAAQRQAAEAQAAGEAAAGSLCLGGPSEPAGEAADGEPVAGDGDVKDGERGGANEG